MEYKCTYFPDLMSHRESLTVSNTFERVSIWARSRRDISKSTAVFAKFNKTKTFETTFCKINLSASCISHKMISRFHKSKKLKPLFVCKGISPMEYIFGEITRLNPFMMRFTYHKSVYLKSFETDSQILLLQPSDIRVHIREDKIFGLELRINFFITTF